MNGHADDTTNAAREVSAGHEALPTERREVVLMRAGGHAFAVFADEADSVTEGLRPTPLPQAPPAILGVVCVRGRMRTVLDPLCLLGGDYAEGSGAAPAARPRFVVSLRGDEQLALAVERVERITEAPPDAVEPPALPAAHVRGLLPFDDARATLLDPSGLFEAAMRGTERRRPRLVDAKDPEPGD